MLDSCEESGWRGSTLGQGAVLGKRHPLRGTDTIRHARSRGGKQQDLTRDIGGDIGGDARLRGGQQLGGADRIHDDWDFLVGIC